MSAIRRTARASGRVFHRVDLRLREKSERKMIPAVAGNGSSFHSCLKPYRDANDAGWFDWNSCKSYSRWRRPVASTFNGQDFCYDLKMRTDFFTTDNSSLRAERRRPRRFPKLYEKHSKSLLSQLIILSSCHREHHEEFPDCSETSREQKVKLSAAHTHSRMKCDPTQLDESRAPETFLLRTIPRNRPYAVITA